MGVRKTSKKAFLTKGERRARHARLGPLDSFAVAPMIRSRYEVALGRFFAWQSQCGETNLDIPDDIDFDFSNFVRFLHEEGEPLPWAQDAASGLQDAFPRFKRNLTEAWRCCGA